MALTGLAAPIRGNTISFTLLGDPNQTFSFARADSPVGQVITEPVGPYPGYLGPASPDNYYGFFCIDYLKTANWNTTYQGSSYGVGDVIPNKTLEQLLEAAYLANKLYGLGGSNANTNLYQGPISFAVWQIMDPIPGHVPIDPAAQQYVQEAQHAFAMGQLHVQDFANIKIFVPNNTSSQDFMTVTAGTPEPGTILLFGGGLLLIALGKNSHVTSRLRRR